MGNLKKTYFSEKEECVICFVPLTDERIAITQCGHSYHEKCLERWFDRNPDRRCPMCNITTKIREVIPPHKKSCWWWICFTFDINIPNTW